VGSVASARITILGSHRILVLDRRRVADSGTHEELRVRGGMYKTLYDRQFRVDSKSTWRPDDLPHV